MHFERVSRIYHLSVGYEYIIEQMKQQMENTIVKCLVKYHYEPEFIALFFIGNVIADSGIDRTLLPVIRSGSFIGHNVYAAVAPLPGDGLTRLWRPLRSFIIQSPDLSIHFHWYVKLTIKMNPPTNSMLRSHYWSSRYRTATVCTLSLRTLRSIGVLALIGANLLGVRCHFHHVQSQTEQQLSLNRLFCVRDALCISLIIQV